MSIPAKLREILGWENKDTIWVEVIADGKGFAAFRSVDELIRWKKRHETVGEQASEPLQPTRAEPECGTQELQGDNK